MQRRFVGKCLDSSPSEDTLPAPRFACPCCAHLTLDERPPGTFAICPVCLWEDDGVQFAAPDFDGANEVTLNEARANFREFGAITREALAHVRPPREDEAPRPKPPPNPT